MSRLKELVVTNPFAPTGWAAFVLRPLANRLLPSGGPRVVRVLAGSGRGVLLPIYPRAEKFYWTGLHERHVQRTIAKRLKRGMVFWDIGAHIGFMSFIAARLVGPSGQVHAFEALPKNIERLKRAVELNGFSNVMVHNVAVGASSDIRRFFLHDSSLMGSLTRQQGGESILVQSHTMDELAASLGCPDLVKIDVEGAEVEVLEGGRSMLSSGVPLIIEIAEQFEHCRSLLQGYKLERLAKIDWLCIPPKP